MRMYILVVSICWSLNVYAERPAEALVPTDPIAIKAQLQDYYFDAAHQGNVEMLNTFIEAEY